MFLKLKIGSQVTKIGPGGTTVMTEVGYYIKEEGTK